MEPWIATAVFAGAYALIASDRIDRTLVALLGGLIVIVFGILDQDAAFAAVDWNVIFLLAGMMILAAVLRRTGVFGWLAVRAVRVAKGDPVRLLVLMILLTAVLSAFLDNVTMVILIAPVTLYIASVLGVSPVPYLVAEIMASNIGGTATLIGDPPNILIGSAADLNFIDFVVNMTPAALVVLAAFAVIAVLLFRKELVVGPETRAAALALDEAAFIADHRLLRLGLLVLGITVLGFVFGAALGQQPATIALLGATVLMLVARLRPEEMLREVDWTTLLFFVGLFMLVAGLVETGVIAAVGRALAEAAGGDASVATLGLLWFSGGASGLLDNIPYTAAMIPVVGELAARGLPEEPLWWALALGACLGGNATLVGASANIVVANVAAGAGHPISFGQFLRIGGLVVVVSLAIASIYLWLRYLS